MSKNTPTTTNTNSHFLPYLSLLFIGLKLTEHIDWSWWWILAPLITCFFFSLIVAFLEWLTD